MTYVAPELLRSLHVPLRDKLLEFIGVAKVLSATRFSQIAIRYKSKIVTFPLLHVLLIVRGMQEILAEHQGPINRGNVVFNSRPIQGRIDNWSPPHTEG